MTGAWQSGSLGKAYRGGETRSGGSRLSCAGRVLFQLAAAGPLSLSARLGSGGGEGELLLLRLRVASSAAGSRPDSPAAPEDRVAFMIDVYVQGFSLNVTE